MNKKEIHLVLIALAAVLFFLISVLVFFSCSIAPDPGVEQQKQIWRDTAANTTWLVVEGRSIVSTQVPDYMKNCNRICFGTKSKDRYNCVIKDGESEYALCYFEFTTDRDGQLYVYDYDSEQYIGLSAHFSDSNLRLKYSDSDFADFSLAD